MHPLDTRRAALDLLAQGWSLTRVSIELGVSRSTLREWRARGADALRPSHWGRGRSGLAHPAPFLRGLFHSDGCRVRNRATRPVAGETRRYEYARWQFVHHSPDIRAWCTEALDRLGIPWRASSWKTVSVSRRDAVARLDELIGPKR